VVAQGQGQAAALNMLGPARPFTSAPFFWSRHYDVSIHYVGYAERWDDIETDGSVEGRDCLLRYRSRGKVLAVASMGREVETLRCEADLEASSEIALTPVPEVANKSAGPMPSDGSFRPSVSQSGSDAFAPLRRTCGNLSPQAASNEQFPHAGRTQPAPDHEGGSLWQTVLRCLLQDEARSRDSP
jgi:hypothetical protein